MAKFESKVTPVAASAAQVYDRFSNLESLRALLDRVPQDAVPADKRELFDQMEITNDTISFPAGPVGAITLRMEEKVEPRLISLAGVGTPVPIRLILDISPVGDAACEVRVTADVEVPMLLKPMISGPLTKAVDQFAQVIASVPFNS